jgi:outer membrane scaffolding protein for murein synthesis (MipA/OmpV family)
MTFKPHPWRTPEWLPFAVGGEKLRLCLYVALLLWSGRSPATELMPPETPKSSYVLGASLSSGPEYDGSDQRVLKLRPLFAYRYGRFMISNSRAGAVLGFAADTPGPGASAELVRTDRWRLGAALRFDSGRNSADSSNLDGLPDIRRTLRGRFYVSYALTDRWNLGASVSQDLLGRQGGATMGLDAGYRVRLTARTEFTAGAGISLADAQNMRTYFGITNDDALRTGRQTYAPAAGIRDFHTGIGITTALSPSWIAFAGIGASTLLGDAASSPLTKDGTSVRTSVGLAYRCCKW